MVSSTFYDLRQIRDDLRQFIEGLGYRPLLSEHPSFPIDPDATTIENCRRRVEQDADVLVLVIGGRYGSIDATPNKSVTNLEYTSARHKRIPIYVFIDPQVLALLPLWKRNQAADFSEQVDSPRLFEFIEHVRTIDAVWMNEFRIACDITDALRTQFAYQQQAGLRLQRQAVGLADQDWLDTLHGEALRVALDRPPHWEYLLFATSLRDGVARHRRLARTHALKIPIGFGEDVQERFDDIRQAELQRLESRLTGLSPEARARVDEVTRLIVEKLLLEPTEQLKALPDEETQAAYTEAVNRLFRLGDDGAAAPATGDSSFDDTQDATGDRRSVRTDRRRSE